MKKAKRKLFGTFLKNWNFYTIWRHYHDTKHFYHHLPQKNFSAIASFVSLSWPFEYPLNWKPCEVYIEGKVLERVLPGKWLNGVTICYFSTHFLCLYSDTSEVWRPRADGLTDLEQPQLYEDLISEDSRVCTFASRKQASSLTTSRSYQSQTDVWATTGFCTESKRAEWYEPITSLSIQRGRVVAFEIQINCCISGTESAGKAVYLFFTCEHTITAHIWQAAAALQEWSEKWLAATAVKWIPPPPFQISHWIQPDPARNTHKCEHPDGLFVRATNQHR